MTIMSNPMTSLSKDFWLLLLIFAGLVLAFLSSCTPISGEAYKDSPGILWSWHGSAIQPWPESERASRAIWNAVNDLDIYPDFAIEVYGPNDRMTGDTVPSGYVPDKDGIHLLMGTTDRVCEWGFNCAYRIRVRQTESVVTFPNKSFPPVPTYSGSLNNISSSALFYEVMCRMIPMLKDEYIGGSGPTCDQRLKLIDY